MTISAKSLFRATKAKRSSDQPALMPMHEARKPDAPRRADDFYPTGQPEAIRALLARDGWRLKSLGVVWEPACGDGALVREIRAAGLTCCASDLIDRGCPDSTVADFFAAAESPAPAIITNPPFNLINARDGKGACLRSDRQGRILRQGRCRLRVLLRGQRDRAGDRPRRLRQRSVDPAHPRLSGPLTVPPPAPGRRDQRTTWIFP